MAVITTALNGQVPAALLAQVAGQRAGIRLATDAAASFARACAQIEERDGWTPRLNTAYRTITEQNALRAQGLTTIAGGRSEHGLARAGDVGGLGGFRGSRYAQFQQVGEEHGWYQPTWATTWRPEPWHWEYLPGRDRHNADGGAATPPGPDEEDNVDAAEVKRIIQVENAEVIRQLHDMVRSELAADHGPVAIYFFTHDGATYEAQLDANTYRRVSSPSVLEARRTVLNRAGVRWANWRNAAGRPEVEQIGAFGRLVD